MSKRVVKKKNVVAKLVHVIPDDSDLASSETELAESMVDQFEAFYKQGLTLKKIFDNREYKQAVPPYSSFEEYMDDRMPVGVKKRQAWHLIAASKIRPLLPKLDCTSVQSGTPPVWTEWIIRPLTNKKFTKRDIERLAKEIAKQVKKTGRLTSSMVKAICDEDLGITRAKKKKKDEEVYSTDTPAEAIERMTKEIRHWKKSLETFSGEMWQEVESDSPGCVKRLIRELSDFTSFLRN